MVHLLLLLAGLGVTAATGVLRLTLRDLAFGAGLAYLAGLAGVMLVGIALLSFGLPFTLPLFVVSAVAVGAGGIAVALWRRSKRPHSSAAPVAHAVSPKSERWIAGATLAAFTLLALVGVWSSEGAALTKWDAWSIWMRKALLLVNSDTLPAAFATGHAYTAPHAGYPILLPLFESMHFRAAGAATTAGTQAHLWIVLLAFGWALAFLAFRYLARPVAAVVLVGAAAFAPAVWAQLSTGYADVPMGLLLAPGVLLLGLWLTGRDWPLLALSVVLLAGSASVKNEGLMAAAIALLVAIVTVALARDRRALRQAAFGLAGFVALLAPWQIHLATSGVKGEIDLGRGLNPAFLVDQFDRVWPTVNALRDQIANQGNWSYLVPLALGLLVLALFVERYRRVAAFYLSTIVLFFVGLVWVYWLNETNLNHHLTTSVDRTVVGVVFLSVAALVHLVADVAGDDRVPRTPEKST